MASQKTQAPITWVQIEKRALEDLSALVKRAPMAARLAMVLVAQLEGGRGVVVMSREAMREALEVSMPSVERALRLLIAEGWVQRMRIGSAHALAVNCRIAWTGPRGDLPRAAFGAVVVASRSEQDAIALAPPQMRAIPAVRSHEDVLAVGPGLSPPSQPELDGVPPPALRAGEDLDRETGEIRQHQRAPKRRGPAAVAAAPRSTPPRPKSAPTRRR